MSDFAPLGYFMGFIMILQFVMIIIMPHFITFDPVALDTGFTSKVVDIVEADFSVSLFGITSFNLNPFSWLGTAIQDFIVISLLYLNFFPLSFVLGVYTMGILAVIYTLIKMAPTT